MPFASAPHLTAKAILSALLAVTVPLLWAPAVVPDSVFHNQIAAAGGWGLWVLWIAPTGQSPRLSSERPWELWAACGAIALCAGASWWRFDGGQGASMLVLVASLVVLWAAYRTAASVDALALAWAWLVAGLLSTAVALVQYFAPSLADGVVVATTAAAGRAVGNMRQPNHLATALLCAMVMTTWLWRAGRLRGRWALLAMVAMTLAVALSASRTGALSLGVLVLWAIADRTLPRSARWTLGLLPLAYVAFWAGLAEFAAWQHGHFYAADRLQSGSDISSSRFAIWRNALALVVQNPWTGVGWGNFNFAWTFTRFSDRPLAFFDHTHNLPLQLAVEMGLPATAAVLGLLGWSVWRARGAWANGSAPDHPARAALMMLVVLGVHSLLEYPLWYAYFLLPGAWAFGVFLGSVPPVNPRDVRAGLARPLKQFAPMARLAGFSMLLGAGFAAWDHRRVEVIFTPPAGAAPLSQRIAEGRPSLLFGHHAEYAAVTNEPRDVALQTFRRPLHQLVDVRLLVAYVEALRANGRDAEALYAAQRLREFRRDDAQAYFKECTEGRSPLPFQCSVAPVDLTWRDLAP